MKIILGLMIFIGTSCTSGQKCSEEEDLDLDGINDCLEAEMGTDANNSDSDGDGYTDLEEMNCVSDPTNEEEVCYSCGWAHNDPGNLSSTGSNEGDVMSNLRMVDQCGDEVDLWDFHGAYHVLYMTAAW